MDTIVSVLEDALLPELERRRALIAEDSRFTEPKVGSRCHSDIVHTIGLSCHPVSAPDSLDSYFVTVNIIAGVSEFGLRGFVNWNQPFIIDRLPGYDIDEARTRPYRLESVDRLEGFLSLLPALFRGFERGIRRGRPPSNLRQAWNRIVFGKGREEWPTHSM